ncbi:NAD(P)-binding protein [Punctularia strigosozonata HHB-11173 SS5]|uniref:NAD(P)-binding protein n=1 Tax=Punctularia strigosozonata (strain HHB-11173) TaxID=741275 RepID=UPI00044162D9|nr:NAD(P)-binding protein [Punctularia strigosozonata HHB-11173 SS5]EIN05612.1 NAD(P)-binding protein [Punctularia strigosozonata HHB-11173 SS5]
MPSPVAKPLALVYGGTGVTGSRIVNNLLKRGHFDVGIITRPASTTKSAVVALKDKSVHIRIGDAGSDDVETLRKALDGAEVLVSAVSALGLETQYRLFEAAKAASVKRVVPCDFGTYTPRGVRAMADLKYAIQDYIKSLELGHTFIDVGWWMQFALPFPSSAESNFVSDLSVEFYGNPDEDKKSALTDLDDVGKFVARIVEDERTLNRYVFVWGEERTQKERWEIAQQVLGEDVESRKVPVSGEELLKRAKAVKEEILSLPDPKAVEFKAYSDWTYNEYQYSMHIRGDNTVANAKAAGALDARELYPDVEVNSFENYAKEFYVNPPSLYDY